MFLNCNTAGIRIRRERQAEAKQWRLVCHVDSLLTRDVLNMSFDYLNGIDQRRFSIHVHNKPLAIGIVFAYGQ